MLIWLIFLPLHSFSDYLPIRAAATVQRFHQLSMQLKCPKLFKSFKPSVLALLLWASFECQNSAISQIHLTDCIRWPQSFPQWANLVIPFCHHLPGPISCLAKGWPLLSVSYSYPGLNLWWFDGLFPKLDQPVAGKTTRRPTLGAVGSCREVG